MNIPLDNLYHWIDSLAPGPAVLYVFQVHGSKKISDISVFKNKDDQIDYKVPGIFANDQEPLDWDFYEQPQEYLNFWRQKNLNNSAWENQRNEFCSKFNLRSPIVLETSLIYDRVILIHSEKNSIDLAKYQQNGFLCVHYWAHGIIARDWYRFAEHDARLTVNTQPKHKFLIYCRDWSHRREYRLKFLELLVHNGLNRDSQTSVMHVNSEDVHFSQHQFKNTDFEMIDPESILEIPTNTFSSSASADYTSQDFVNSEISVVLETVFDDSRIHLTEKTLRPIACGHPFILAAGPGALEYVRSYGFKTFAPWIDESYDQESNSLERLKKITSAMKQIQSLGGQELEEFRKAIKEIAEFNKKHFFSTEFFNTLTSELKNNLNRAYAEVTKTQGTHYLELLKLMKKQKNIFPRDGRAMRTQFLRQLRLSCRDAQSSSQADLPA